MSSAKGKEEMMENIDLTAKYKSYCFGCGNEVLVGEKITLRWYFDSQTAEYKPAWPHLDCINKKTIGFI